MNYLAGLGAYVPSSTKVQTMFCTGKGSFSNLCSGLRVGCFAAGQFISPALKDMFQAAVSIEPAISILEALPKVVSLQFAMQIVPPNRFMPKYNGWMFKPLSFSSALLGVFGQICETLSFYNAFDFSRFSCVSARIGKIDAACNGFYLGSAALSLVHRNWANNAIRKSYGLTQMRESEHHKLQNFRDVALMIGTGLSLLLLYKQNKHAGLVSKVALRAYDCLNLVIAYKVTEE